MKYSGGSKSWRHCCSPRIHDGMRSTRAHLPARSECVAPLARDFLYPNEAKERSSGRVETVKGIAAQQVVAIAEGRNRRSPYPEFGGSPASGRALLFVSIA